MSERMTNILGYLTLAAILGAIWILFGEDPTRDQGARGERTFAGLAERVNETASLSLAKGDESLRLERSGDTWGVVQRNSYPANVEMIRAFLRGLALSKRREPKTANPVRFDRLGLGESATRVRLADDTGGSLLDVSMGTRKENTSGRSLTYIFQETDTRAWLVGGLENAPLDPAEWLDTGLLDINEARIRSVTVNGTVLERGAAETAFRVAGLADGETGAAAYKLAEPSRTLSGLSLIDVQKTGNPLVDPIASVEAVTHDGLIVSIAVFMMGEDNWAQIDARHDVAAASEGEAGILPEVPGDGPSEAASIAQKTKGWLFKLSSFDADILKQERSDFVDSPEADAAAS